MSLSPILVAAILALISAIPASASPSSPGPEETLPSLLHITERSDFSRYIDGHYLGLADRRSLASLAPSLGSEAGAQSFAGQVLALEETMRDERSAARRVDRSVQTEVAFQRGAPIPVGSDSGFPMLRSCPAWPDSAAKPPIGATWTASGSRSLFLGDSGAFVILPFLAEYHFQGMTDYRGEKVIGLKARFATHMPLDGAKPGESPAAPDGDFDGLRPVADLLRGATGSHELDILVDAETLAPLFIRDRFDESFNLANGKVERRTGFNLIFFERAAPMDRGETERKIAAAVAAAESGGGETSPEAPSEDSTPPGAGPGPLNAGPGSPLAEDAAMDAAGLELGSSPQGIVLTVKDLRFIADSDAILPTELWRLDAIAAALKTLSGRSFLVAGHSAAVGKASGELKLSIERAKRVSEALIARGIDPTRLLYQGFGSSRPLAPNDTEAGRAKNRRVEITVLE